MSNDITKNRKLKMLLSWVSKIRINLHFVVFLIILIIEIVIAKYEFHSFIRGFIGDVLVIPLIYHFIRSCWDISPKILVISILIFAFGIEIIQLLELANVLGIESKIIKIIIGTTFDPWDLIAYGFGAYCIILTERVFRSKRN